MRKCIGADLSDTTATVQAYLQNTNSPFIRHLYMIGDPSYGRVIMMTDHEAPIIYPGSGVSTPFSPAVIKRSGIQTKMGLEVQKATITWTPGNLQTGVTIQTASPLQLARLHFYDNWQVRIWRCFLPSPGGLAQVSACEWFGGRIANCLIGRNEIEFTVNSFLDIVTQKLPPNVIESTSTLAGFTAATLPIGDTVTPIFTVFTGSTTDVIYGDTASHHIYPNGQFKTGYLVFLGGPGSTLGGVWSAIGNNLLFTDGHANNHNEFDIYTALPWAPTPGVDTFYVSKAAPINLADGNYFGFPYVPQPTTAA